MSLIMPNMPAKGTPQSKESFPKWIEDKIKAGGGDPVTLEGLSQEVKDFFAHASLVGQAGGLATLGIDGKLTPEQMNDTPESPVQAQIDRNYYDDYQLWMELYYKGYLSQIDASITKAIMFDGFQDTENINTVDTTADVDTTKKRVLNSTDISNSIDIGFTGVTSPSVPFSSEHTSNFVTASNPLTNMIDGDINTFATNGNTSITEKITADYDLGSVKLLRGLNVLGKMYATDTAYAAYITKISISEDGNTWEQVYTGTSAKAFPPSVAGWRDHIFDKPRKVRYIAFVMSIAANATYRNGIDIYEVKGMTADFNPSNIVKSDVKNLSFTPNKVRLYLASKKPLSTDITPTVSIDGVNFEGLTLVTSRPDPKFSGYTEEEYEVTPINQGQQIILNLMMNTTNPQESPEVKRYGIHLL